MQSYCRQHNTADFLKGAKAETDSCANIFTESADSVYKSRCPSVALWFCAIGCIHQTSQDCTGYYNTLHCTLYTLHTSHCTLHTAHCKLGSFGRYEVILHRLLAKHHIVSGNYDGYLSRGSFSLPQKHQI